MCRRAVRDELTDVGAAVAWVDAQAAEAGLSGDVRNALQVCVEEALVNLIVHARGPDGGGKAIALAFTAEAGAARVAVTDRCAPYDITREAPPAAPTPRDMHEGGMGLRLIRGFASDLSYVAAEGRNTLTMAFRPGAVAGS